LIINGHRDLKLAFNFYYMETFEVSKKKLEQESFSSELVELKNREQEMRERLSKIQEAIAEKEKKAAEAQSLEESKKAIQRGKLKILEEEWAEKEKMKAESRRQKAEEQKVQAKEILKKFLEKEEKKKKEILIDEKEQEKLIEDALLAREREAERLLHESPAYEDLKLAQEEMQKELLKPKVLEVIEVKFFEENELPEKAETDLLTDSKKLEAEAKILAKQCEEAEKQIKEKGVDVNKMELSLTERMKFSIKSLFDKKLRNLYRNFEMARTAEDSKRSEAQRLRLAATKPEEYKKRMATEHFEYVAKKLAERRAAKMEKARLQSPSPISWIKRF
jgi:hypothetical protein